MKNHEPDKQIQNVDVPAKFIFLQINQLDTVP